MPVLTLDFETYYSSKDYSLSKLTTEEYIRDPRFEAIGAAWKWGDGPTVWYPGGPDLVQALAAIDWTKTILVAHNAMFDAAILRWQFGHMPAKILDTLSIARSLVGLSGSCSLANLSQRLGLGVKGNEVVQADGKRLRDFTPEELAQYGRYCRNDVELTYRLFAQMATSIPADELDVMSWTSEQFADPILEIDVPLVEQELRKFTASLELAREALGMTQEALRSDPSFAMALAACGVSPPTKWSEKQEKEVYAFAKGDVEFMDLLEHEDPRVVALVEARLGNKTSIAQSRLERFVAIGNRGTLPVPLSYSGAMTTKRWAGTDKINLQNLPRKGTLRKAIRAPKGWYMVAGDESQIELRMNAFQSGQFEVLAELTKPGGDTYASMATDIYGYNVHKETHPVERFVGKTAVLGCGYGCGGPKFQLMLQVAARRDRIVLPDESEDFAKGVVKAYREKNPRISAFWKLADHAISVLASGGTFEFGIYSVSGGKLFLPNGQYLYYPNLRREADGWVYDRWRGRSMVTTKLYGAKLVENITQAASRLPMSDALRTLRSGWGAYCRPVFVVHDEVVTLWRDSVPREEAIAIVRHALVTPRNPLLQAAFTGLPLAADVKAGETYGDVK